MRRRRHSLYLTSDYTIDLPRGMRLGWANVIRTQNQYKTVVTATNDDNKRRLIRTIIYLRLTAGAGNPLRPPPGQIESAGSSSPLDVATVVFLPFTIAG